MVSKNSFKIVEDMPPDSLHRVKQGTTLPLNIQVGPPGNNLPLPVNGSKDKLYHITEQNNIKQLKAT